jgi:hypothetical protein
MRLRDRSVDELELSRHYSPGRPATSLTGRISTVPIRAPGIRAAMLIASSRSLAVTRNSRPAVRGFPRTDHQSRSAYPRARERRLSPDSDAAEPRQDSDRSRAAAERVARTLPAFAGARFQGACRMILRHGEPVTCTSYDLALPAGELQKLLVLMADEFDQFRSVCDNLLVDSNGKRPGVRFRVVDSDLDIQQTVVHTAESLR